MNSSTSIHCPKCDRDLSIPHDVIGKKIKCTKCNNVFMAQEPELKDDYGYQLSAAPSEPERPHEAIGVAKFKFECPSCHKKFIGPTRLIGQQYQCKRCTNSFAVVEPKQIASLKRSDYKKTQKEQIQRSKTTVSSPTTWRITRAGLNSIHIGMVAIVLPTYSVMLTIPPLAIALLSAFLGKPQFSLVVFLVSTIGFLVWGIKLRADESSLCYIMYGSSLFILSSLVGFGPVLSILLALVIGTGGLAVTVGLVLCIAVPFESYAKPFAILGVVSLIAAGVFYVGTIALANPGTIQQSKEFMTSAAATSFLAIVGKVMILTMLNCISRFFKDHSTSTHVLDLSIRQIVGMIFALILNVLVWTNTLSGIEWNTVLLAIGVGIELLVVYWFLLSIEATRDIIRV